MPGLSGSKAASSSRAGGTSLQVAVVNWVVLGHTVALEAMGLGSGAVMRSPCKILSD